MRLAALFPLLVASLASAQAVDDATARCTRRMSHLLGLSYRSSVTTLAGSTPQQKVREWLATPQAIRSFARFTNARFNPEPAANTAEDGVYAAVRFVLSNNKPWRELFTGRYVINHTNNIITEDAAAPALGYFGSVGWQRRYLGNAPDGLMLRAAYRVLHNTIGLKLTPSAVNFEGDATATGRERAECRGCHFDSPYALDKVAQLLPRKVGVGGAAKPQVTPVTPQLILGGLTVGDFEHLVDTLTRGDPFAFRTCRLAFEFAYGRPESGCEAPAFDRCVDAFTRTGLMVDALASYLEDPQYCEAVP
ncbi:MAG: hypothetical protein AB1938_23595 [Myxococcota bacterium]